MPKTTEALVVKNQLTKSGTSIGANYREANRSRSKKDFKNKIRISLGEASETDYWLEIIEEINWINNNKINDFKERSERVTCNFYIHCK